MTSPTSGSTSGYTSPDLTSTDGGTGTDNNNHHHNHPPPVSSGHVGAKGGFISFAKSMVQKASRFVSRKENFQNEDNDLEDQQPSTTRAKKVKKKKKTKGDRYRGRDKDRDKEKTGTRGDRDTNKGYKWRPTCVVVAQLLEAGLVRDKMEEHACCVS
jgi:hypothetical protein